MTSAFMQIRPGQITIHPPQQFMIGDTWEIAASCNDGDGLPIDLRTASITWVLNETGGTALELTLGDGIVLLEDVSGDPLVGQILIEVSSEQTALLVPGFFLDELTVTVDGKTFTQFRGRIEVLAKLPGYVSGG